MALRLTTLQTRAWNYNSSELLISRRQDPDVNAVLRNFGYPRDLSQPSVRNAVASARSITGNSACLSIALLSSPSRPSHELAADPVFRSYSVPAALADTAGANKHLVGVHYMCSRHACDRSARHQRLLDNPPLLLHHAIAPLGLSAPSLGSTVPKCPQRPSSLPAHVSVPNGLNRTLTYL